MSEQLVMFEEWGDLRPSMRNANKWWLKSGWGERAEMLRKLRGGQLSPWGEPRNAWADLSWGDLSLPIREEVAKELISLELIRSW